MAGALLLSFLLAASTAAAPGSEATTLSALGDRDGVGTLRGFIQDYLTTHGDDAAGGRSAKASIGRVRLSVRDPKGYVVYVTDGGWCGSGGCHVLVVTNHARRFEPLGFFSASDLPIAILPAEQLGEASICVRARDRTGIDVLAATRSVDSYDFRSGEPKRLCPPSSASVVIPADAVAVPLF